MKELIDFCMHHNGGFRIVMINKMFHVMVEVPIYNVRRKKTEYASFSGTGNDLGVTAMNAIVACERYREEVAGIQVKMFKS